MSVIINKLRRRPSHEYAPYQHLERHFESAEIVRDTIIGLSGECIINKKNLMCCRLNVIK
jgi:hypothetical protein